tara:strand:+ start:4199 stop:5173 length:975 start_codon:yes stop_codon:yes gene_type:complete
MIKRFLKFHPIHKKIVPYFDKLFLLRPSLFFPVWIMISAGMISSSMQIDRYRIWINEFNLNTFLVFFGITLVSGATFIINQIHDVESDDINEKLFLFKDNFSIDFALKLNKILLIAAMISLIPSGISNIVLASILYCIWGVLYNLKPFEYKQNPLMGLLINIVAGLILFLVGWNLNGPLNIHTLYFSLPYLLCFSAVSIVTAIPDIKGDLKIGKKTFPIKFGERFTIFFAMMAVLIAFLMGIGNNDPVISTASLVSLPFYIFNLFSLKLNNVLRTIRFSVFNLGFFLMSVYPYLFLINFINFYLIKYYYWHRFDIHYPSFLIDE